MQENNQVFCNTSRAATSLQLASG